MSERMVGTIGGRRKGLDSSEGTSGAVSEQETVNADDLVYWPAAHNVKVETDAEIVMFSPQREHSQVITHMIVKVTG
jgi:hypothetical protein